LVWRNGLDAMHPVDGAELQGSATGFLESGIPRLDTVLGGPLRRGALIMVVGAPGMGKTILGQELAFHRASLGESVLYLTGYAETHDKLVAHSQSLNFFDQTVLGQSIHLGSVPDLLLQGPEDAMRDILTTVRAHRARLVVLDGFRSIRRMLDDGVSQETGAHFLYALGAELALLGATTVVLVEGDPEETQHYAEFTICDVVIALRRERHTTRFRRLLEIMKVRGAAPLEGQHPYLITADGISLWPRFESVVRPMDARWVEERAPFGVAAFDALLNGGLNVGTVTLVAGSPGAGKTLLGLHFVAEGARLGESCLFLGFMESPEQLHAKGRAFGMDLETLERQGLLHTIVLPGHDLEADAIGDRIREEVERRQVRRLVIDSAAHLERMLWDSERRPGFYSALVGYLRAQGVTTCLNYEVTTIVGPELDFGGTPLSILAENLLLLRQVEVNGRMERIVSVLQMRFSDFDHGIRNYVITPGHGIQIMDPSPLASGLLTGSARGIGLDQ